MSKVTVEAVTRSNVSTPNDRRRYLLSSGKGSQLHDIFTSNIAMIHTDCNVFIVDTLSPLPCASVVILDIDKTQTSACHVEVPNVDYTWTSERLAVR
jgi:hypothetical protein